MRRFSLLIIGVFLLFLLLLYGAWWPSATLFGPVMTHGDQGKIYLTFDDGPGTDTMIIAGILRDEGVPATFFIVGTQAMQHRDSVELLVLEGHSIGVHTYSHGFLLTRNEEEISQGKDVAEAVFGSEITVFRPPYGFRTWATHNVARREGLTVVTWSVFPRDYRAPADKIIERVCGRLHDGAIIALHDGPYDRSATAEALPAIIDCARDQGYSFGTL